MHDWSEDRHQVELFNWAESYEIKYPCLKWMHHSANGGKRRGREASKFKNMGVKKGVADIYLPVVLGGYYGFYIELKSMTGSVTQDQIEFGDFVRSQGYYWEVIHGWEEAANRILQYLSLKLIRE